MKLELINLIEKAAKENFVVIPCHKDWNRSYLLIDNGKFQLYFNVPIKVNGKIGLTTKMIEEE